MSAKPIIALDADGVLLDYGLAYASAWERALGHRPLERDKDAYSPLDRWAVKFLEGERLAALRASGWSILVAGCVRGRHRFVRRTFRE